MGDYGALLAALVALLLGLAVGKAWERYKLRDGRWIDRRKARQSPHYIIGLNFLVAGQIDLAIEELTKAAGLDADALEIHMILGNLYREKGQVGRAVNVHQALLQRPRLTHLEHAHVLLVPWPRLPERRLHRSRARGLQGGPAARPGQPLRADESPEAARRAAPVAGGVPAAATGGRARPGGRSRRAPTASSRSSSMPSASMHTAPATSARPPAASRPRSSSIRTRCRHT